MEKKKKNREPNGEFIECFLLTFRHFITKPSLLISLFQYFNVYPPESSTKVFSFDFV